MKRATLKDIARLTGLSVSGVSRALKDHPDISKETKDRVREVAKALNYRPNPNAQILRTQSSRVIAVILPKANTFFFPELLQGIGEVVSQKGYSLMFLQSDNSYAKEKELVDFALQSFAEGVLISLSVETQDLLHLFKLKEAGTPVVLIDRVLENETFPYVTIDDRQTTQMAVEALLEHNHQKVLGIFDDPNLEMTRHRIEGFKKAHELQGLPLQEDQLLTVVDENNMEYPIRSLIERHDQATAIFAMSDKIMVRTYHVLNKMGLRIPDDIALLSISDGKAPYYLFPNISHFRHSGHIVGTEGTMLLFDLINGKKLHNNFHKIETEFIKLHSF